MLENSVWRQYNKENNFREKLSQFCSMSSEDIVSDDKVLYGILKAKLTKKELKLFAMDSANIAEDEMKKEISLDDEKFAQAKFNLYKKLKQDKTRLSFKESTLQKDEEY